MGGLAALAVLQTLTLQISCCSQLANVDGLRGLAGLAALQTLELSLSCCSQLANVDGLQGLAGLAALQTLELDLSDCEQLSDCLQQTFRTKDEFFLLFLVGEKPSS